MKPTCYNPYEEFRQNKIKRDAKKTEEEKVCDILEDRLKDLDRLCCEYEMILDAIDSALGGAEPSDFELSFPIVRKAWDMNYFEVFYNKNQNMGTKLLHQRTRLLTACQVAYRKHALDDPDIGWDELGDLLYNALSEVMGDDDFSNWLSDYRHLAERG